MQLRRCAQPLLGRKMLKLLRRWSLPGCLRTSTTPVYQGVALPALPKGLQSLPDYLIGLRWQLGLELVHVYLWVHVLLYHRWWVPARYFGRLRAGPVPPNTAV